MAYFAAIFHYLFLCILLIRGVNLPGALHGILFYLKTDFYKLLEPQVGMDLILSDKKMMHRAGFVQSTKKLLTITLAKFLFFFCRFCS